MTKSLNAISPYQELLAYETIWARRGMSLSKITKILSNDKLPSQVLNPIIDLENEDYIKDYIKNKIDNFTILTSKDFSYPQSLKQASNKYEILYCKGDIGLLDMKKKISIVGTRAITEDGIKRTKQLAKMLSKEKFCIVSGLAKGVDTVAMTTAIENGGKVIGVIGTPINEYYPKENKNLQDSIAKNHLLVSHVPMYRYKNEPFQNHKFYFPQRNVVMASISDATIIVEAGETSGTLIQARECMRLKKKLFILRSCYNDTSITWPKKYEKQGAIIVDNIKDILDKF